MKNINEMQIEKIPAGAYPDSVAGIMDELDGRLIKLWEEEEKAVKAYFEDIRTKADRIRGERDALLSEIEGLSREKEKVKREIVGAAVDGDTAKAGGCRERLREIEADTAAVKEQIAAFNEYRITGAGELFEAVKQARAAREAQKARAEEIYSEIRKEALDLAEKWQDIAKREPRRFPATDYQKAQSHFCGSGYAASEYLAELDRKAKEEEIREEALKRQRAKFAEMDAREAREREQAAADKKRIEEARARNEIQNLETDRF